MTVKLLRSAEYKGRQVSLFLLTLAFEFMFCLNSMYMVRVTSFIVHFSLDITSKYLQQ